jgi:tetratricopeptide (TPR) repeat protein
MGVLNLFDFPAWIAAPLIGGRTIDGMNAFERLVDAQLLERPIVDALGQDRYRIHDLLRLFARERLAEEESELNRVAALQRVLEAFLTYAELADTALGPADILKYVPPTGRQQTIEDTETRERIRGEPLAWLGVERLNLIVAIEQAFEAGRWELTWRLGIALAHFFDTRCHWSDWEHTHQLSLAATQKLGDIRAEAYVLDSLGITLSYQTRFQETEKHKRRALQILQELGDRYGEAYVLRGLGMAYFNQNRFNEALTYLQASLTLFEQLERRGDHDHLLSSYINGRAYGLYSIGLVHENQGRLELASQCLEQSAELFRQLNKSAGSAQPGEPAVAGSGEVLGAVEGLGLVLCDLGELYRMQPKVPEARRIAASYLKDALAIFRRLGNTFREARTLERLGKVDRDSGANDAALQAFEDSVRLFEEVGSRRGQADAWRGIGEVDHASRRYERARDALDKSLALARECNDRLCQAKTLRSMGTLFESKGDDAAAAAAWNTALQLFDALGTPEATEMRGWLTRLSGLSSEHA